MKTPRIAVTMGDPAGIGPEIVVKACRALRPRAEAGELKLLVVGTESCFRRAASALGVAWELPRVEAATAGMPALALLESAVAEGPVVPGEVSAEAGRLAYAAIERSVGSALDGSVEAIVTAPISKEALNRAGYAYAGHTELLAALTGSRDSVMMLAHGNMRVSHVSTHVALAEVPKRLTPERLDRVIELTRDTLADLGIDRPRIAVAALNPHAGEGGMFGQEDSRVTVPAVARWRERGLEVEGPVPGDTVFVKLHAGQYDAVVAMYHDQGHIPVKLLGFSVDPETGAWDSLSGVNVTLGLPIIRSSVDHGTAFDIAGKGLANEQSLIEAIDFAVRLGAAKAARAAA
ncbi:4-hydroxythreonine-4-phosphate dehydrogenase [Tistlia consotensis]|uniref:4-hydroxythreonine-4-phosphate dehydrogenase n=1 Tax=Tistlia consotensis USBA 355 TaxID=560819 RepID=A0A1Y6CS21_9PROT|nr:4-hydroxythreonine-4-phosphate dehydrogenase PdxA [Tistlia consotensis]SMF69057.1 4-hydroxythreonine-4-phosphate dehydrogenase [Tistlia consotensis USBA 355]SNS01719.1 4-hydroxythreonine-4-phosphate dehydrogenase [Tistlia consotensis]